jgi:hypothetical protein
MSGCMHRLATVPGYNSRNISDNHKLDSQFSAQSINLQRKALAVDNVPVESIDLVCIYASIFEEKALADILTLTQLRASKVLRILLTGKLTENILVIAWLLCTFPTSFERYRA